MTVKNVTLIVGTRPQIIKSRTLVRSLCKHGFQTDVIDTGQHYDHGMSGAFFSDFDPASSITHLKIKPGTPCAQLSEIVSRLGVILQKDRPDFVVVPGDTTSALAAAIAAVKCSVKLAHLEAGGRSIHTKMQEEINRRLIDHASDILFAPTKSWAANLKNENVPGTTYFVGDTMYDLFLEEYRKYGLEYTRHNQGSQILVTLHRAEKITDRDSLAQVCGFVNSFKGIGFDLIFPVHPHTRRRLDQFGLEIDARLLDPVDHMTMMKLVAQSSLVVTDSGGLQKEAYWMSKPCIAVHETFEWKELVDRQANFPVWPDKPIATSKIRDIVNTKFMPETSLFGAGDASEKISGILEMQ